MSRKITLGLYYHMDLRHDDLIEIIDYQTALMSDGEPNNVWKHAT